MAMEIGTSEEFDFDASTDQAWELFCSRLAEVISVVDDGETLTLGTLSVGDEGGPRLTFTCLPCPARHVAPTIRAQATGNELLGEHDRIGAAQLDELRRLGWQDPVDHPAQRRGFFWVEHEQDECTWLAQLAVDTLRDVYGIQHPVFLAPDQLAEILQPEGFREVVAQAVRDDNHPLLAVMPGSHAELVELVAAEITHMFGHEPLRDAEGDFSIRVGSTMVFVRVPPDIREIVLFSALVHDVEGRSRAAEVLNDLNHESRFGRFNIHRDRVYVSMSLLARPFVPAHLHEGVQLISQIADGIDGDLAQKLRGRTTFTDDE